MDILSLRFALRAAEHLSFRAAARSLSIGQGALSRRVRALEDEIGVSLFERHRGGVRVTAAGREFLARVKSALDGLDSAVDHANTAGRAETGSFRIGFFHSLASGRLRDIIVDYRSQWPHVQLEFLEAGNEAQMVALRERQIDVGFVVGAEQIVGLDSEPVWTGRGFIALPEHHALALRNQIALSDLQGEAFLMRSHGEGSSAVGWLAARRGAEQPFAAETSYAVSRESLLTLVGMRFGVTIVAESATGLGVPGVVFRPIKEPGIVVPFRMVWFAGNDNPALRRFLSRVRAHVSNPIQRR